MNAVKIGAACLLAASVPVSAQTLEERLEMAESRLASLEQQNTVTDRISINGFIRFATETQNNVKDTEGNDVSYRGALAADEWDNRRLTRAGVQFNARINDDAEAVIQLLSRGTDDFDVEAQWAYIGYNLRPDLKLRAGRIVLPFYLHSQYLNVGYAYPWVEMPTEVYGAIPVDTMEGLDGTWTFNTGNVNHNLNLYWGATSVEVNGVEFETNHQRGINLRSNFGDFTSWLSYNSGDITLDLSGNPPAPGGVFAPYSLDRAYAHYIGVGLQYDNGSLLIVGERTELKIDAPDHWFPTQPAGYVLAGYRFGKLMPHITWAFVDAEGATTVNTALGQGLFSQYADRQKSWTLGARYDLTTGIALKAEATRYYDFSNDGVRTQGTFSGPSDPACGPTGICGIDTDNPMVFRLAVDAVF